ncbi:MAG TPA: PspA/IM30 family protein [Planctomicrobium sp.]|nr:PspA/IM30 family protein [Planctomicrobium sp.]
MAYFSRLTDIITCNLTAILNRCENAEKALEQILSEMREGVAGAERCVRTALTNVSRLEEEIETHRLQVNSWISRAQDHLQKGEETAARECLRRKLEIEDLIAGLEQQLQAAIGTRDHLQTMMNALQARVAEAYRRLKELRGEFAASVSATAASHKGTGSSEEGANTHSDRVDAELEELRKQLNR